MGRCAIQIVMGPAGSGKSTYCHAMQQHAAIASTSLRLQQTTIHVANLDPAAEVFLYEPAFDIRDLISVTEVMEELGLGPNGALLYCMEYLMEHLDDWLHDELEQFGDDEYLMLDCPGQLELYTHVPIMRGILDRMREWGYDGSMVSVFCVDAAFLIDASKFISGSLLSLSAMVAMELPHVSVLTKCDLMDEEEVERILDYGSATQLWGLEQDRQSVLSRRYTTTTTTTAPTDNSNTDDDDGNQNMAATAQEQERLHMLERRRLNRDRLTSSISQLLDDWEMVSFVPLNITSEDSLEHVLSLVNHTIQYGEDLDVKGAERDVDMPGINVENDVYGDGDE